MPRRVHGKCVGVLLKLCLLLPTTGLILPIGVASPVEEGGSTHPKRDPRPEFRICEGTTSESSLLDISADRTDLRNALATFSKASHVPIDGAALEGSGRVPVTLSLHKRTEIQALRAIMSQVPGGGFVFVEGHRLGGRRAYVLGGLDAAAPVGNTPVDIAPLPHGLPTHTDNRHTTPPPRGTGQVPEAEYIDNELLLEFAPELDGRHVEDIVGAFGGEVVGAVDDLLTKIGYHRVRFPAETDVTAIAPILLDQTPVKAAELNYVVTAMAYIPNDPLFFRQWGLIRTQVPAAWEIALQQRDILVAVLDSGVDPTHPELEDALTDGWDFIADDDDPFDEEGHGTAMSGIIAAARDNERGIAGVAPGIKLMPVRVLDGGGKGSYAEVMRGLVYAADRGARIINMSFGGYAESRALSAALAYAHQKGALLIAAAGNEGVNARVFPAADPTVIGIASTNASDEHSDASNWGSHVLLAAPGERIPTLLPDGGYALVTGTSPAAAHVTGIAALVFSVNPMLRNTDCAHLLVNTAEDLGSEGWDQMFGFGQVNAAEAVEAAARL